MKKSQLAALAVGANDNLPIIFPDLEIAEETTAGFHNRQLKFTN
jgi:hypothetical protein